MSHPLLRPLSLPLLLSPILPLTQAFTTTSSPLHLLPPPTPPCLRSKIVDAEFTHDNHHHDDTNNHHHDHDRNELTLIEYSQNQDPDWKSMPVAFCDAQSNTYIDCTLAFYVRGNEEGREYALGVPCETPLVVVRELESHDNNDDDRVLVNGARGGAVPLSPDADEDDTLGEEERKEIFEIAARAMREEFGEGIRLKKTPRVLTAEGDLDGAIGDWREVLVRRMDRPGLEEAMEILDQEEEEGERYFDRIMRRDLGEDYMKLLEEDEEDGDEIDEEILKLFDVNVEDLQEGDLEEFLKFLKENGKEDEDANETKSYDDLLKQLKPSAALRLLSFIGPDGKEYSVLRPLRPILLVGKEDPEDYTRRILLTAEEQRTILPKLERKCREELEQAGFFLTGGSEEK